ncbi:hypothetical protein MNB_SM-3-17 [hydrothermal vent metagenome]|uniref:Uncharacterized protein n=1 Tax=hydrothermal vent metagenome TaxID=652676 RepID=A0A1W1D3U4_9ZZZZ
MKNKMIKIMMILALFSSVTLFGAVEEKVIMCNALDAKYDKKVFRKATILMTEARLKLEKKYKKFLTFEYQEKLLKDKKSIKKALKKAGARYYVYVDIVDKSKGKCPNKKCKVDYILKLYDGKKNKKYKLKLKAYINNNEFTEIKAAHIRSATKKLVRFLKAR